MVVMRLNVYSILMVLINLTSKYNYYFFLLNLISFFEFRCFFGCCKDMCCLVNELYSYNFKTNNLKIEDEMKETWNKLYLLFLIIPFLLFVVVMVFFIYRHKKKSYEINNNNHYYEMVLI
jgi:hypothetical protein